MKDGQVTQISITGHRQDQDHNVKVIAWPSSYDEKKNLTMKCYRLDVDSIDIDHTIEAEGAASAIKSSAEHYGNDNDEW